MHKHSASLLALAFGAALSAQNTVTIPENLANAEGGSNTTIPWNRVGVQTRVLYQHDPRNFLNQGVAYPITISEIAWRANGNNTSGPATFPSVIIDMSTAATSWQSQSATYANNHGGDFTNVYNGGVTTLVATGSTPGIFHASAVLSTPFSYDPLSGSDLCIEALTDGFLALGQGTAGDLTTGQNCSRLWDLTFATSGVSANVQPGASSALKLTYTAAAGLWPAFTFDADNGPTPLTVNFTDTSITDDPAGIQSWVWDFDGDGTPDSNLQNPSFTYTTAGIFDVALTVFDTVHGQVTLNRPAIITAGAIDAQFHADEVAAGVFLFTDDSTGVPSPDNWAWDFDNDGTVDSTAQNPSHIYATPGPHTVSMTATNSSTQFTDTIVKPDYIDDKLFTMINSTNSWTPFVGNFMNLTVTHPDGLVIGSLDMHFAGSGSAVVDVYVTNKEDRNKDDVPGVWRKVATGTLALPTGSGVLDNVDISDFYLPPGGYGVAVYATPGLRYTNVTQDVETYALTYFGGRARTGLFGGTLYNPRNWNGRINWEPFGTPGYGFFGEGCPGSAGVASMTPSGAPRINTTFTLDIDNAPANAAMFLIAGFSTTSSTLGPLPFDLGIVGMPNCDLYVAPIVNQLLLADPSGHATWTFNIPNDPGFFRQKFFNQAMVLDPSVTPGIGAVASDAWGGIIGL